MGWLLGGAFVAVAALGLWAEVALPWPLVALLKWAGVVFWARRLALGWGRRHRGGAGLP